MNDSVALIFKPRQVPSIQISSQGLLLQWQDLSARRNSFTSTTHLSWQVIFSFSFFYLFSIGLLWLFGQASQPSHNLEERVSHTTTTTTTIMMMSLRLFIWFGLLWGVEWLWVFYWFGSLTIFIVKLAIVLVIDLVVFVVGLLIR